MGRMIGRLSNERTCYVSSALLEIVSELTKCPPTIDEKGLLIKATYPLTGLEVYVRLLMLDPSQVSSVPMTTSSRASRTNKPLKSHTSSVRSNNRPRKVHSSVDLETSAYGLAF